MDTGDGWCVECGDFFHLDDIGGYNPPCRGCGNCRDCCECHDADDFDDDDDLAHMDDWQEHEYMPIEEEEPHA